MSASYQSDSQSTYPLSPNPNSEFEKSKPLSFGPPRTPQSPLGVNPSSGSSSSRPIHGFSHMAERSFASQGTNISAERSSTPVGGEHTEQVHESGNKRKHDGDQMTDHKDKKIHVEERKPCIDDLHQDVGKIYQLCRTPHPPTQPDLSQDLYEIYGLNAIAAKVARTLPNGDKNGLRKTYKGKIKELGISGKFDVKLQDEEAPSSLLHMLKEPDLEWGVSQVSGRDISKMPPNIKTLLPSAMTMHKGIIPKAMFDSSVLGELEVSDKKAAAQVPHPRSTSLGTQRSSTPTLSFGRLAARSQEAARPKRAVKKRGYDESSYEGYGEGFVDDDMADGGYSTGDGDDRGGAKRRKKASQNNNYARGYSSYGPGSVGS